MLRSKAQVSQPLLEPWSSLTEISSFLYAFLRYLGMFWRALERGGAREYHSKLSFQGLIGVNNRNPMSACQGQRLSQLQKETCLPLSPFAKKTLPQSADRCEEEIQCKRYTGKPGRYCGFGSQATTIKQILQ